MTTANPHPHNLSATLRRAAASHPETILSDTEIPDLLTDAAHAIELRDRVIDDLLTILDNTIIDDIRDLIDEAAASGDDIKAGAVLPICLSAAEAMGRARGMLAGEATGTAQDETVQPAKAGDPSQPSSGWKPGQSRPL